MPSFLTMPYYIPSYVTAAIILVVVYISYATTNGEHRFGFHVGRRLSETVVLALLSFVLPKTTFGTLPVLNMAFPKDLGFVQIAILWGVVGLVVSSIVWLFKHDFTDHSSKLYVGQADNEVRRTVNVVVTHEYVTRQDDENKAAAQNQDNK
ncbi:MAG: hypothetical protein ACI38Q_01415 [Candidatus Bruticola sp.]